MLDDFIVAPERLFRFRSTTNLGRVIQEISCLSWFSSAEHLNDPFDGLAGLPTEPVDELHQFQTPSEPRIVRVSGTQRWMVACFATTWESGPMWAHYANCGKGVCLSYKPNIVLERLSAHQAIPMLGRKKAPMFRPVDYVDVLPDESIGIEKRIFEKAISWKYEKEWRAALLGLEHVDQKGGMRVNLRGALDRVLIGWAAGPEIYTPVIDAVNKLRNRGESVQVGLIRVDEKTRQLRIDWPWESSHVDNGKK